ncbi:MAG: divalent-cation tolerance protein CutA [Planctomycetota bacterium]|nr:divalent-cation tolerance protein CutA [Planctomycetota bacterium]
MGPPDITDAVVVVFSSAPDAEVAKRIARALVERRIAACVQVLPGLHSTYRWQGAIEEASEVLLLVKTRRSRLGDLELALRQLHPYEVPECVAVEAAHVAAPYRAWVLAETA